MKLQTLQYLDNEKSTLRKMKNIHQSLFKGFYSVKFKKEQTQVATFIVQPYHRVFEKVYKN